MKIIGKAFAALSLTAIALSFAGCSSYSEKPLVAGDQKASLASVSP